MVFRRRRLRINAPRSGGPLPKWLRDAGVRNWPPVTRSLLIWITIVGGFLFVLSLILLIGPPLIGAPTPEVAISAAVILMMAAAGLGLLVTLLLSVSLIRDWRARKRHKRMVQRQRIRRRLFG